MTTSVLFMCFGGVIFVVYLGTSLIQIVATALQELKTTDLAVSGADDLTKRVIQRINTSSSLEDYAKCAWLGRWTFLLGLIGYLSPGGWLTALMLVGATLFAVSSYALRPHLKQVRPAMNSGDSVSTYGIAQYALLLLRVGAFFLLFGVVGCVFF